MKRHVRAERPDTCILSNGLASRGVAVPGAIAAKPVYPQREVAGLIGDAGFTMNSQDTETALRVKMPIVILIWTDPECGLIT